jgi:hypothetical protein
MFAIYVRVSEVGDREGPGFGSPEEQEAAAREWAERAGVEVYFNPDECVDLDVSGAVEADDRKLGRLIERCEAGEFEGIIVRDENRFSRDPIEGVVALDRLDACGARLKATWSGFDSENLTPEAQMLYEFKLSMGKAERARNRLARVNGSRRAADRGVYLASSPPLGYRWVDGTRSVRPDGKLGAGRIEPDPVRSKLVREVFRRRAEGESLRSLAEYLRGNGMKITKSGVRVIFDNRAYLGEATVPTEKKGEMEVRKNAHKPIVTEKQWELAQAAGGTYIPRSGKWSMQAALTGMALCSGCEKPLSVHGGGKRHDTGFYSCTSENCPQRVGIRMERLDSWAAGLLQDAVIAGVPELIAVLEGDDRHARALETVNLAALELEEYRREVKVSDVGAEARRRDVASRQETLNLARQALAAIPAPKPVSRNRAKKLLTYEEAKPGLEREQNQRFFEKIVVHPVGRGRRVPVEDRVTAWFVGAERPADMRTITPVGDPETLAILKATHKPEVLAAARAENAAQKAATEAGS